MAHRGGTVRVGISGWRYAPWRRGTFYPDGLKQRCELHYASRRFGAIEINGTFYSLQRASSFRSWRDDTPDGFLFALKGGRFVTHMRRLKDTGPALANFFASGVLELGDKLGPILWQLPASFRFDADRLAGFFDALPRTQGEAVTLARRHDGKPKEPGWSGAVAHRPIRHALEVRHPSFADPTFPDLLREHGVALVLSDAPGWAAYGDATADFAYIRLHGAEELYASGYENAALDSWAERVRIFAGGGEPEDPPRLAKQRAPRRNRDVFVFFDNDAKVRAPHDAMALMRRLDLAPRA